MDRFIQENNRCWFSYDYIWSVIQLFSNGKLLIYRESQNDFEYYTYTGFIAENWDEVIDYIKNHTD